MISTFVIAKLFLFCAVSTQAVELAEYVKTATGSINGGNTFPGVSRPFGIVKIGPDVYTGQAAYSGYAPEGNLTAFSMLHLSGTGGAPKYGVVAQMPVLGNISNPLHGYNATRSQPDFTELGYYKSWLNGSMEVELAATTHAGMFHYTFPEGSTPNVIVDVSHVLYAYRGQGLDQSYLGGNISVSEKDGMTMYRGYGSYDNGWNRSPGWRVYFCGHFSAPASYKTFVGHGNSRTHLTNYSTSPTVDSESRLGAVFTFNETTVTSRVGVSFISTDQACANVEDQIAPDMNIGTLRNETRKVWDEEVLSKVTTTDTDENKLQQLYTALYFMHLLPINKTGENPGWDSDEPYYDDIFTLWDIFRCTTSLYHILQPKMYEEFIRSLIDVWRHDDYMPDGRSSFWNGATQGGSNSDTVLADAYVKGVRGKVNWGDGFAAMVKNAEVVPPVSPGNRDRGGSAKDGRGALPDWLEHGFITPRFYRSVSRAVEYAGNDFALRQVAVGLNKDADAAKYLHRSRYWRNHWNGNATSLGFKGFLVPRDENGFISQDPMDCGGCYWGDHYYQGLPWEYSFNVHHDVNTIIALSGGPDSFVEKLDMIFKPQVRPWGNERFNNTMYDPGNQPSFGSPYLYNFAFRQDRSVEVSRFTATTYFSPTPGGLPGNSDAGAMESWLLWVMIGLYPITGQTTFLVGSPWFSNLNISLGDGRYFRVTSSGGSDDAYQVQSLKVNGKEWDRSWVEWSDVFENGGEMHFELGTEPANWATGDPPPSPASEYGNKARSTVPFVEVYTAANTFGGVGADGEKGRSLSILETALISVLSAVSAVVAAALAWCIWRRRRSGKESGDLAGVVTAAEMQPLHRASADFRAIDSRLSSASDSSSSLAKPSSPFLRPSDGQVIGTGIVGSGVTAQARNG